jgi:hypothetical protein
MQGPRMLVIAVNERKRQLASRELASREQFTSERRIFRGVNGNVSLNVGCYDPDTEADRFGQVPSTCALRSIV